jgi:DNA-directed RNA polymerase specialized sigma24 family protein
MFNTTRRTLRRGGEPEPLDCAANQPSPLSDPADQTVQREEEAILGRTLEEMPENYPEPLVLFYCEQQSVAEIATQRLSATPASGYGLKSR